MNSTTEVEDQVTTIFEGLKTLHKTDPSLESVRNKAYANHTTASGIRFYWKDCLL